MLLCERYQADGSWEDLLRATAGLRTPPNIIVFSRLADESLWAEVLNMGGFDVLIKPFQPEEVLRVTFAAWSRWECDFCAAPPKKQVRAAAQLNPEEDAVGSPCLAAGGAV